MIKVFIEKSVCICVSSIRPYFCRELTFNQSIDLEMLRNEITALKLTSEDIEFYKEQKRMKDEKLGVQKTPSQQKPKRTAKERMMGP